MENMTAEDSPYYEGVDNDRSNNPESREIVCIIIYSLVFVLGVAGNGVVIWVTGFKMKKTINTVWYLNLAAADFLFAAFLPLIITDKALHGVWPFGSFMCKLYHSVLYVNMFASVYFLTVISVDRCACVVWPVFAKNHRTVMKASCVSLGVWVLAFALSSPYFVFMDSGPDNDDCFENYELTHDYSNSTPEAIQLGDFRERAMTVTRFLVGFVVPFTVIVCCYSVIIYRLRKSHSLARRASRSRSHSKANRSSRPFKIIASVIASFFLCWAPFHIWQQIQLACGEQCDEMLGVGFDIAIPLAFLNSCLNPLLYVFMTQDFKSVFRRSILAVLEKAFSEELPQTNAYAKSGIINPNGANSTSEEQL